MVDIWFYGQSCFKVKGKSASIVFDPYSEEFTGLPKLKLEADIVCVTHDHKDHNNVEAVSGASEKNEPSGPGAPPDRRPFVISGPGEYEISGVNIVGIDSFHDDKNGEERGKNTIYHVVVDEVNIVHLGDLGQKKLTQEQAEALSTCDVFLIPVGGIYTISAKDVPEIIAQIEPKIVIPMHYKLAGLKFDLDDLSKFLTVMGKEKIEPVSKLSISFEKLPEEVEIAVLEKQ